MNCPDFDTLMMLLDGELGEERMKEVAGHVRSCSRCRNLVNSQRNLETSWRDNFVTPEDDKFRRIEWIIYRRIHRRKRWKFFVPAAAGIIAVLLGVKLIMDNEPFKGRVTDLLRDGRTEYASYTLRLEYEQDESTVSDIDGFDPEEAAADESIVAPTEEFIPVEDVTGETTSRAVGYGIAEAEVMLPQSAGEEDGSEESLRGTGDLTQETDLQSIAGGEVIAGGSGGSGSASPGGFINEEEFEEAEIPDEIIFAGAVEGSSLEEQTDDICSITSLSDDTAGLAVTESVPAATGISEDMEGDRGLNRSFDYYSPFHEVSDQDLNTVKTDIYVELVFDAGGQPDSCTALLLDSLFAGWSDYIPFVYRDTVLVVPLAGVLELFVESSTVRAETIE